MLRRLWISAWTVAMAAGWLAALGPEARAADAWQTHELPVKLTVGYAVRAIDMNGDKRLDIAIVDSKRVLWLENPTWQEHVIYSTPEAKADNVCFAPHDVDGDGLIDFALGADWQPNNTASGGSIGWLHQKPEGKWTYEQLTAEPTTHRMHWVELAPGKKSLVVAPLKGPGTQPPGFDQTGVRILALTPSTDQPVQWHQRVLYDKLHVMHNFDIADLNGDHRPELLCASYEGVTWLSLDDHGNVSKAVRLGVGQEQAAPARGASEVRHGVLKGKRPYLSTIEPWHGDKVVVYIAPEDWSPEQASSPWERRVLDDQLAWGHAIACTNLDDDPEDELVIGIRDNKSDAYRSGVRIYDPTDASGQNWQRTLIDPGGVAVEDLVAADFDGDGRTDLVAVGRATHNAKIYFNRLAK